MSSKQIKVVERAAAGRPSLGYLGRSAGLPAAVTGRRHSCTGRVASINYREEKVIELKAFKNCYK